MNTLSPAIETLRLFPGDRALPTRPVVGGRVNCHKRAPDPASSAITVLVVARYITPSCTCGVACIRPELGTAYTHFGASRATFDLSICVMAV
jgi:hypothetical protein